MLCDTNKSAEVQIWKIKLEENVSSLNFEEKCETNFEVEHLDRSLQTGKKSF
jgi:hypothetical protein